MTSEAFGQIYLQEMVFKAFKNRKQNGFEIGRNLKKRTLPGGESDRETKMYSSSDLNY